MPSIKRWDLFPHSLNLASFDFLSPREHGGVEVSEEHLNENKKALFIQHLLQQGLSHLHRCPGKDSEAGREWESFIVGQAGRCQVCLVRCCWHVEAGGRLTRSEASYVSMGHIGLFPVGLKCKVERKIREAISY